MIVSFVIICAVQILQNCVYEICFVALFSDGEVPTSTVAALFSKTALTGQKTAMVDMIVLVFPASSYLPYGRGAWGQKFTPEDLFALSEVFPVPCFALNTTVTTIITDRRKSQRIIPCNWVLDHYRDKFQALQELLPFPHQHLKKTRTTDYQAET